MNEQASYAYGRFTEPTSGFLTIAGDTTQANNSYEYSDMYIPYRY